MKNSAPDHLSADARAWWDHLTNEYDIADSGGRLLLQTAMEAFDRMRGAAARVAEDGEMVADRFGQLKAHPMLTVERDARSQMLMSLKQLNLEVHDIILSL